MVKHTYDYTVEVRRVETEPILDDDGKPTGKDKKVTHWDRREVTQARDLEEVLTRLKMKNPDDIRYVTKTISKEKTCDCTENPCAKLHNDIINDLDYQPSEPFWDEPETTRDPRRKTQDQLLPEIPARTIPEAPLRSKKNQSDDPLPLETVYINASQGRLF